MARRRRRVSQRAGRARARKGDRLDDAVPRRSHAARRRGGDAIAACQPRVRDAHDQGRDRRPLPRAIGLAPVDRQARAGCPRARVPDGGRGDVLCRHVGRPAVQARLSSRCGGCAGPREPRGRTGRAFRMAARHATARSDVRQRNDRDRSRADRRRPRARPRADVRFPEARVVRRPDVATHSSEGARPRHSRVRRRRRSSRAIMRRPRSRRRARTRRRPRSIRGFRSRRPMC